LQARQAAALLSIRAQVASPTLRGEDVAGKNEKRRALSAQQIAEHAANLQSRGFTVVAETVVDAPLSKPSS
jgi:hypothetical protein